jgi:hypothetical protein
MPRLSVDGVVRERERHKIGGACLARSVADRHLLGCTGKGRYQHESDDGCGCGKVLVLLHFCSSSSFSCRLMSYKRINSFILSSKNGSPNP